MTKLYCCYCGDAKGDRLTCCDEVHFVPYEELPDDLKDDPLEEDICPSCNGSGEGMYDGTKCSSCRGKGVC